jgi:hypothetical protein
MQSSSKMPAIIGILLVVCAVGYYFYSTSNAPVSSDSSLTLTTSSTGGGGPVGSDVLSLLSEINGLNIDTSFFQTPVYESLTDFSVTIPSEPVGKSNPFMPLYGSALPNVSTSTINTNHGVGH